MRPYRRQLLVLLPLLGLFALIAQLAGVGTTEQSRQRAPKSVKLVAIPGGSVPDIGSSTLDSTSMRAARGEVVRMSARANVRATKVPRGATAQVVCGIRYSRDGDASWTLGTPFETVLLERGARERVVIARSFEAPARDRYRMSMACHVAAPERGAQVMATGSVRAARGLPTGAATPVE